MFLAYRFLEGQSPEKLSKMLWQNKIGHQVVFQQGVNELWVVDAQHAHDVKHLISVYEGRSPEDMGGDGNRSYSRTNSFNRSKLFIAIKSYPITLALILITLFISLITELGRNYTFLGWFTITPIVVENNMLYTQSLTSMLDTHSYWRLFTPAFLHFSMMHLVFNLLWIWEIGRKLEIKIGSFLWLFGALVIAISSNLFQYWEVESPLFGGLSGLVYGCIGFAWLMPYLNSKWASLISPGLMVFFMIWLGIGYTDLPSSLGLGNMANTAHLVGLISGLLSALVYGLIAKIR
ncbi:rhomboid family intramembrane serine protease [Marinomonas algicola]|uniref:rhomboid family intramembrane serine protease n=1 Tax=Marinomonas algicola TaxID=2773454 RepID=UPI00174E06FC|nr:rhomboid family intramembrane serine protease [Marinomonas algicola]